jgi:2-dehydro-3-deoxygalactonokinase
MTAAMSHLLGIDWGTTSLRGARLGADGAVLEQRSVDRGAARLRPAEFEAVFDEHFGDWMAPADTLCLIGGMAGSKQGWVEAPYCACPARIEDLCRKLTWIGSRRIAILPGLSCNQAGIPDVMRGEESQIFGALHLLGRADALLVLPGTHSKWVQVRARRVESFSTLMTGEFYALLRRHSLLARSMPPDGTELDAPAFDQGVALALSSRSLMQTAFSVRTLSLFGRIGTEALSSYLSGLVIGEELRSQLNHGLGLDRGAEVLVVGAEALTQRYERALSQQGIGVKTLGAAAGWRGLWLVAQALHGQPGAPAEGAT